MSALRPTAAVNLVATLFRSGFRSSDAGFEQTIRSDRLKTTMQRVFRENPGAVQIVKDGLRKSNLRSPYGLSNTVPSARRRMSGGACLVVLSMSMRFADGHVSLVRPRRP